MFKIRRPAIIGLLVVLLVFTGYINHQLTQQAVKRTSKEYQEYEAREKEKYFSENEMVEVDADGDEIDIELEEDKEDKEDDELEEDVDIKDILESNEEETEEVLNQELSAKNINHFVEYRLSRDKLRASSIDRLNEIINNSNTNENIVREAQEEIIDIGRISEQELQIESLIKSKGFEDALVFLTDKDVKVIVSSEELGEQDMVKILDVLKSETDYDMNDIKIMKKQ